MKHVDAFETTALPDGLGRAFATDAPCVAVLVESRDGAGGEESIDRSDEQVGGVREEPSRRASVTVFRVGDGYVVECEDADGATETVGMGPGQLEAYVERVREDEAWTVLSVADEGAGLRRDRPEGEPPAGR